MLGSFSITPLGGSDSVGDVVAGCVRIVRDSGLPNETSAMFTTVEGDTDEVFAVLQPGLNSLWSRVGSGFCI
jgi:uncharacterized protein YqgV (UPF0045/DUF77 family)